MCTVCRIIVLLLFPFVALSFTTATANDGATRTGQLFVNGDVLLSTRSGLSKVGVFGATGRTGQLLVGELLDRGIDVVAIVRNAEKAESELPCKNPKVTGMQSLFDIVCSSGIPRNSQP